VNNILREAMERLRAAGIDSSRSEARLLWEHAEKREVPLDSLIVRRVRREPIAYIVGHKEFWSLEFEVGPGALIPRPETEILIEQTLRELPDREGSYRLLELGTGTGCLLIACLMEYANASGIGIDSSEQALGWARRNVARYGLEGRCKLERGTWSAADGPFDLILANPPYIPSGELDGLPADVRDFEPRTALDGGWDGLDAYRAIVPLLRDRLAPRGVVLLEIGAGQHHLVREIIEAQGLNISRIVPDLAGIPRCLVVRTS
jgi:release factor glutamine methyltransferase